MSVKGGVTMWMAYAELNLMLALWARGRWAEVDDILLNGHSMHDDFNLAVSAAVRAGVGAARGVPCDLPWSPEDRPVREDPSDIAWLSFAEAVDSAARGDLVPALSRAMEAVETQFALAGTIDDFTHLWPFAAELALEAGAAEELARLLDMVDGYQGRNPLGVRAHRHRLAGLVAMQMEGSPEVVETELRAAVAAFDEWDALPYHAKAQGELGTWLVRQGRTDEGAPMLEQARAGLAELGASAWLDQLESQLLTR